jgi:hypothetical protein
MHQLALSQALLSLPRNQIRFNQMLCKLGQLLLRIYFKLAIQATYLQILCSKTFFITYKLGLNKINELRNYRCVIFFINRIINM